MGQAFLRVGNLSTHRKGSRTRDRRLSVLGDSHPLHEWPPNPGTGTVWIGGGVSRLIMTGMRRGTGAGIRSHPLTG